MKFLAWALALSPLTISFAGETIPAGEESPTHQITRAADLNWVDAPGLPAGAKLAVLAGNPQAAGPFTLRLKMPAGFLVKPHTHPTDELVTVIEGTFKLGIGSTLEAPAEELKAQDFFHVAKDVPHYGRTDSGVIIQISGQGPWGITFENPADSPARD
jgi:uncharacterized RmlC-like cupin family protein